MDQELQLPTPDIDNIVTYTSEELKWAEKRV